MRRVSATIVSVEKAMNITYSECVSPALINQHAVHMRRMIFYLCPHWLYHTFSRGLISGTFFWIKLLNVKYEFWFSVQILPESFLILRRIEWNVIKMYINRHVNYPLLKSDFNETRIFPTDFSRNIKFNGNLSSGSRLFPCGQTERHGEANSRFSQFCQPA
jgi:hypothetical protein